jgi:hypothetical protein
MKRSSWNPLDETAPLLKLNLNFSFTIHIRPSHLIATIICIELYDSNKCNTEIPRLEYTHRVQASQSTSNGATWVNTIKVISDSALNTKCTRSFREEGCTLVLRDVGALIQPRWLSFNKEKGDNHNPNYNTIYHCCYGFHQWHLIWYGRADYECHYDTIHYGHNLHQHNLNINPMCITCFKP